MLALSRNLLRLARGGHSRLAIKWQALPLSCGRLCGPIEALFGCSRGRNRRVAKA